MIEKQFGWRNTLILVHKGGGGGWEKWDGGTIWVEKHVDPGTQRGGGGGSGRGNYLGGEKS